MNFFRSSLKLFIFKIHAFMISCFSKLIQDSIFAEKCVVQGPFSINLITKCIFGIINLYIYIYIYIYISILSLFSQSSC